MVPGDGRTYRNLKDFLALLSNDSPLVNHAVSIGYASTPLFWSTRNCVKDRQVLSVITWRHNVQQKSYWTRPKKSIKSVPRAGSAQRFVLRQGPATGIYFFVLYSVANMAAIPKPIGSPRDWHVERSMESERENRADDQLLTVQEIAGLLKVPVSWVYGHLRKRCTDRLPAYRLGKYWRFRGDEVLAWVARHRSGWQAI